MSELEDLLKDYEAYLRLPWQRTLAGPQKVLFVIYAPAQERRLRLRMSEFEMATRAMGHSWQFVDINDYFGEWMGRHEYREAYFERPELMDLALKDFAEFVTKRIVSALISPEVDEDTVVAVGGVASLFGLVRASPVIQEVAQGQSIRGRLLVFFPGELEDNNYRLLGARDGWNYLGVAITGRRTSRQ